MLEVLFYFGWLLAIVLAACAGIGFAYLLNAVVATLYKACRRRRVKWHR